MELNYAFFQQLLTNFSVFVEGILLFQTIYMTVQYALTQRAEFLWYILYLMSAAVICINILPGVNFFKVFVEGNRYGISLLSLSSFWYWIFWKQLFDIKRSDGAIHTLINYMAGLLLFHAGLDILANSIPALHAFNVQFFGIMSNIPNLASLWLFYYTFRTRDKILSSLLVFGALAGNILTIISFIPFFKDPVGLPQDNSGGLFWFLLSYLVETVCFSCGLAYQTRQVFQRNKDLEIRVTETKMAALRAQMNPHFIHNCLNAINRFILNHENEAAFFYLTKFSRLIRDILNHSRATEIALAVELQTIRQYLEMETLRFNEQFDYDIQVAANIQPEQESIPPLLIQPFVENAIYHGLLPKKGAKKVSVSVEKVNNQLIILITDNGVGRKEAARSQSMSALQEKAYGAQITQERVDALHELTGVETCIETIDLYDEAGNSTGTQVMLKIPCMSIAFPA